MRQICLQIDRFDVHTQRNPTLDELEQKVWRAHASMTADLQYMTNEGSLGVDHEQVTADTRGILRDANKAIELIVWLGVSRQA